MLGCGEREAICLNLKQTLIMCMKIEIKVPSIKRKDFRYEISNTILQNFDKRQYLLSEDGI
jgi:hypothetical protein